MCEKCEEIDRAVERYRRIQRTILDQAMLDGADTKIAELEKQKIALHRGNSAQSPV